MIIVVPAVSPWTKPAADIVATAVLPDVHVPVGVRLVWVMLAPVHSLAGPPMA